MLTCSSCFIPTTQPTRKPFEKWWKHTRPNLSKRRYCAYVRTRARRFSSPLQRITLYFVQNFADGWLSVLSALILVELFDEPARFDLPHNLVRDELFRIAVLRRGHCACTFCQNRPSPF